MVDDGSTDGSADVIRATIEGDSRFRLIQQPENRGLVAARNTGIEATSGEYVVFHDIDDLMMRDSLADRLATLRDASDADVAGAFCGQRIADEGVRLNELPASEQWQPRAAFVDFVVAGGECPFGPSQAILRTDVVRTLGGFNKDFETAEDWEFWSRIMRHGFVFRAAKLLSVAYRQKWASMAQTGASRHVSRSVGLIGSAYTRFDLPAIDVPASYPFPEPLPHYQELLTRTRRAIQYASTALVRGDVDAFDEILGTLDPGSWPLVRRHVSLSGRITDGLRRAAGLDLADLPEIVEEFAPLCAAIEASVANAMNQSPK